MKIQKFYGELLRFRRAKERGGNLGGEKDEYNGNFGSRFLSVVNCLVNALTDGVNFPNPVGQTLQFVLNPVEQGLLSFGNLVKRNTRALWSFSQVEQENLSLRQQVEQLTGDNLKLKEEVLAGMRFEDLNQGIFRSPTLETYEKVGASIIKRNPTAWYQTMTVNRGIEDGIKSGDCVIAQLGLVGKVVTVYPDTSEVLLISDGEAQVGALVRNDTGTAIYGIVQGTYKRSSRLTAEGTFQMLFRREDDVNVSDLVLTSGLGGIYPKDIPIGKIKEISLEKSTFENSLY